MKRPQGNIIHRCLNIRKQNRDAHHNVAPKQPPEVREKSTLQAMKKAAYIYLTIQPRFHNVEAGAVMCTLDIYRTLKGEIIIDIV